MRIPKAISLLLREGGPPLRHLRATAAIVAGFLLGLLVIANLEYVTHRHREIREEKANLAAVASSKARELSAWLAVRQRRLSAVAGDPEFASWAQRALAGPSSPSVRREFVRWAALMDPDRDCRTVRLVDSRCRPIAEAGLPSATPTPECLGDTATAIRTGRPALLDFHLSRDGRIVLHLVTPLGNAGRNRSGAVVCDIDPSLELYKLIQTWPIPSRTAEVLVVRKDGNDILYLNDLRFRPGSALNLRLPASDPELAAATAARGTRGPIEGRDYRDEKVLAAVTPVPGTGWFLIAKKDLNEVLSPVFRVTITWIAALLALLGLVTFAAVRYWLGILQEARKGEATAVSARDAMATRLEAMARHANDAINLIDKDYRMVEVNDRMVETYGWTRDELIGMDVRNLRIPELRDALERDLATKDGRFETVHRRKDGTSFPVEIGVSRFRIGERQYTQGIIRDITDRKMAEAALMMSERTARAMMDALPDIALITDTRGIIQAANVAAGRALRLTPEELVGRDSVGIGGPETSARRKDAIAEVIAMGRPVSYEAADGDTVYHTTAVPVRNPDGSITRIAIFTRDVTARRRGEKALRDSEGRYRLLAENLSDVIWSLDMDLHYTYVSPSVLNLRGITPKEAMNQGMEEVLTPDSYRVAMAVFAEELAAELAAARSASSVPRRERVLELDMVRRDGTVVPTETKIAFIRGPDGTPAGIQGISRDISERRTAERKIRQAEEHLLQVQKYEAIGKLAGGIAHDFNNLLTVINSYCEMLMEGTAGDERLHRQVAGIDAAARRATELTGQLLAFGRRQMLNPEVMSLNRIISEMGPVLERLVGEDIVFDLKLAPDAGLVRADSGQITQVIMNLAGNARDAMPEGGRLTIETANAELDGEYAREHIAVVPGSYVMLAVSDTGSGMDEKTMARVFEPFFTTKEKGKGTGLGLATAYGIVKQSHGSIWVYSEPGKGTTFKVYLPLARDAVENAPKRAPVGGVPTGTETILVVEDESAVRSVVRAMLEGLGYRIIDAEGGAQAMVMAGEFPEAIHLMLSDVVMPGMNGPAVAARMADIRPGMPVMFMSGYMDHAVMQNDILAKGAPFIQKPFAVADLGRKVREVMDRDKESAGAAPAS